MDRRTALLSLASATILAPATLLEATPALAFAGGSQGRLLVLEGGEFAMQTSRLAVERSRSPSVRQFAQLEINEQMGVAASLGAAPGSVPLSQDHAAMLQQLSTLSGSRFDRMYVRGQIMGHEELLQINTQVQQSGADPVGIAVANVAIPSIQTHLTILERLDRGA